MAEQKELSVNFECQGCGVCCKIEGCVFVSASDIENMAEYLEITKEEFKKKYIRSYYFTVAYLKDRKDKKDWCVFLDDDLKCKVYDARPYQCLSFPFWKSVVVDGLNRDMLQKCPGMGKGKKYTMKEIGDIIEKNPLRGII